MQAANRKLAIAEIRDAIISTARKTPPAGTEWNGRYGVGRVDATAAILTQIEQSTDSEVVTLFSGAVANGSMATPNGTESSSMTAWLSGMAETAQKLRAKVRFQVEVEPLEK